MDDTVVPDFALTLHPEWAWCIADGAGWPYPLRPKLVENRTWLAGTRFPPGCRLAIHAGARASRAERTRRLDEVERTMVAAHDDVYELPVGWRRRAESCTTSAIVAVVTIAGYDDEVQTAWDVPGQWHWRLRDVVALPEPVPCRGRLGLWRIQDEEREQIARALEAARG